LQVESAREHRTPLEQIFLGVVEVVVGPGHRGAQRVVAFQPAPGADQQPKPLIRAITARTHITLGVPTEKLLYIDIRPAKLSRPRNLKNPQVRPPFP